jgi:dethiobiotin synthetase
VGKTLVAACLARALRLRGYPVQVLKPLATGIDPDADEELGFRDDDALLLRAAAGADDQPLEAIRFESWPAPLAPQTAAQLAGRELDYDALVERVRMAMADHEGVLLIEGVGGVAVPIAPGILFSDFLVAIGAPETIVVARSALGTINHTVLTLDHLRGRDIPVLGLIFTRVQGGSLTLAEDHGPLLAGEVTGARVLGLLEHAPKYAEAQTLTGALCSLPWEDPTIQGIVDYITHSES